MRRLLPGVGADSAGVSAPVPVPVPEAVSVTVSVPDSVSVLSLSENLWFFSSKPLVFFLGLPLFFPPCVCQEKS